MEGNVDCSDIFPVGVWNQEKADELIPDYMQEGLRRYLEHGIMPGGFLSAVLCNDLKGTCGQADAVNQLALSNYIRFLYNYAPSGCYGSPEKVQKWCAQFK